MYPKYALGEKIAKFLWLPRLGKVIFSRYSDGEFQPSFGRIGKEVHGYYYCDQPIQKLLEKLMEMLLMLDAQRAISQAYTAVMACSFGWARQRRKIRS